MVTLLQLVDEGNFIIVGTGLSLYCYSAVPCVFLVTCL